jgi:hypothetical protein
MSEKKTIILKDEDLKIPNKTRKIRPSSDGRTDGNGIRVKSVPKREKSTLKKRSILRMIREHQEDKYRKLYGGASNNSTNSRANFEKNEKETFDSDFKKSAEYLEKISNEPKLKPRLNSTIKHYPNDSVFTTSFASVQGQTQGQVPVRPDNPTVVSIPFPEPVDLNNIVGKTVPNDSFSIKPPSMPLYSSMKNGSMPTYRNWMRQTQRNVPQVINQEYNNNNNMPMVQPMTNAMQPPMQPPMQTPQQFSEKTGGEKISATLDKMNEMKQTKQKLELLKKSNNKKKMKQKKIARRTFKLGKSKVFPRISVLVSNKTIRNNILTKTQMLKTVPIQDIKKFLIKKGFIKVGSSAPNDVLRKMYESVVLICGEVNNHNPDNLFYNYLNGGL